MLLTKLSLAGNKKLFLKKESLVCDIPAGEGKIAQSCPPLGWAYSTCSWLSLICAAGLTVGFSWTQSCPSLNESTLSACDTVPLMSCRVDDRFTRDAICPSCDRFYNLTARVYVPFMCCRVDCWLLMDSILPTIGLSLLYLLLTLPLLCAAGLTVGSSWTQSCPPLGWVYSTCSWLCPFYMLQGWRLAPHGLNPAHPWAESTLPTRHHCHRPKNYGKKVGEKPQNMATGSWNFGFWTDGNPLEKSFYNKMYSEMCNVSDFSLACIVLNNNNIQNQSENCRFNSSEERYLRPLTPLKKLNN
jgi:hypothetical protein